MTRLYVMALLIACVASAALIHAGEPQVTGSMDIQGDHFKRLRDPFWPIGHQPISESEQVERSKIAELKSRISWPALPLRGITHTGGKQFIAMIEGAGLVEPGDIVAIRRDALTYRWRIDDVTAEGVASTRLDVTETVKENSKTVK